MRKIQVSISMYLKTKYSENFEWLKIFEWRFKSKEISNDEYFNKCLYYVNYNAVKHWIIEKIEDYPYSSIHQLNYWKQEKINSEKEDVKIDYTLENWLEKFFEDFEEFEF